MPPAIANADRHTGNCCSFHIIVCLLISPNIDILNFWSLKCVSTHTHATPAMLFLFQFFKIIWYLIRKWNACISITIVLIHLFQVEILSYAWNSTICLCWLQLVRTCEHLVCHPWIPLDGEHQDPWWVLEVTQSRRVQLEIILQLLKTLWYFYCILWLCTCI